MNNGQSGIFTLPPVKEGAPHTLVIGPTAKGKSLMPDNSDLTMGLATQAFEMINQDNFSVSANLSADNTESLRNFGLFQSMLLMAYKQGALDSQEGKIKVHIARTNPGNIAEAYAGETESFLANAEFTVVKPHRD